MTTTPSDDEYSIYVVTGLGDDQTEISMTVYSPDAATAAYVARQQVWNLLRAQLRARRRSKRYANRQQAAGEEDRGDGPH